MDATPEETASQVRLAEVLRQFESNYWKRTGMPLVLRRLESGKFDKNEMRVILHLIRLGCRPWHSVQMSATKIGNALGLQTVKVGAVLKKLVRRGVLEVEEGRLHHAEAAATTRLWRVSEPDTWDRPPTPVSEADRGSSFSVLDGATRAALLEMARELEDAEPGKRHFIWDGPKVMDVIGEPSTYPAWLGSNKSHRTRQYAHRLIGIILFHLHLGDGGTEFGKKAAENWKIFKWLRDRAEEQKARHPDRYSR